MELVAPQFNAVKANMLNMLEYSKIEFNEYKQTGEVIKLQQAGEKLFNALENYIQFIYKVQARSFYEIKNLVREKPLKRLLYDAKILHQYFYNGELEADAEYITEKYNNILKRVETRIKRL